MTLATTSQLDHPQSGYQDGVELTSLVEAAEHVSANCLVDTPIGLVGLELEAHCFDLADPTRRPGWQELCELIESVPTLPGGSSITVEPGGAVELSTLPLSGVVAAIEALSADRAVLRKVFGQAGLGLVLLGADPLRPSHRVNPGARYRAMEQYFAAADTAMAGAAMMTSTASIQVNIEAGPAEGWTERVRLAHALGPTMIAIAANSPLLAGEFTGWRSTRQWVWSQLDTARCGPILGAGAAEPAADWARYAMRAPVMLVHNPDPIPVSSHVAFADWVDGQVTLAGRRPTRADLDYHLTTLFPPVRPRRWLEIRYLDSVPDAIWPALAFTLVTLLDEPVAADVAAEATETVATAWDNAARLGLEDRRLQSSACRCVQAAAALVPPTLADSMERLMHIVESASCPGEEFADATIARGVANAVVDLARGDG